jgi:hypothetical protein
MKPVGTKIHNKKHGFTASSQVFITANHTSLLNVDCNHHTDSAKFAFFNNNGSACCNRTEIFLNPHDVPEKHL